MKSHVAEVYIALNGLFSFSRGFFFGLYVVFLTQNGLDPFQVNLINTFYMLCVFFMEVPTGVVADIFGRKASTILGFLSQATGMLVYFVSSSFPGFLLAEFIAALGSTFISGAFEAWAYDHINDEQKFLKAQSKAQSLYHFGSLPSAILGGIAASYFGVSIIWFLAGSTMLIFTLLAVFLMKKDSNYKDHEPDRVKYKGAEQFKLITKQGFKHFLSTRNIVLVTLAAGLQAIAFQPLNMFWQLIYSDEFHIEESKLGFIFAGIAGFVSLGSIIAGTGIIKKNSISRYLTLISLFVGVVIFTLAKVHILSLFMLLFFLHEIIRGSIEPLNSILTNQVTPSHIRATTNSIVSMFSKLAAALGLFVSGLIAVEFSIRTSWAISGIVLVLSSLSYFFVKVSPSKKEN